MITIFQGKHASHPVYRILFLFALGCLFAGCGNRENSQAYFSTPSNINESNVKIIPSLEANLKDGELFLHVKISNNSKVMIIVDYFNCSLFLEDGRGTLPEPKKTFKTNILPGEVEYYDLIYHPVNSLDYFNMLNYRGDLKRKYGFKTDFIKNTNKKPLSDKTITFDLETTRYQNYLHNYGHENRIQLFEFAFDQQAFIRDQKEYILKNRSLRTEKSGTLKSASDKIVFISNLQININNQMINLVCSKQNDTLIINALLFNMGIQPLKVKLDRFSVEVSGQKFVPNSMFSEFLEYNNPMDDVSIIKQGMRFNILLKYRIPEKFKQFNLSMDWLYIQDNKRMANDYVRLCCKDLKFQEISR